MVDLLYFGGLYIFYFSMSLYLISTGILLILSFITGN